MNRTSFPRALMAALESDNVSLKGDADEGRVELAIDGETDTRIHPSERSRHAERTALPRRDEVLERLAYENLDRIWLERTETDVREGRKTTTKTVFDLHVVRTTSTGATYEDAIAHLSESERDVTGLVFALAGYLVHDVYKDVPFMLLDSLEAIEFRPYRGAPRLHEGYSNFLVAALLLEDAAAVDDDYLRITEIEAGPASITRRSAGRRGRGR